MAEWISKTLGELTSFISKGIPPKYVDEENENTIRVLNQKCNRNFEISYNESRIHNAAVKKVPENKLLHSGDVLINSTGTGTAGRVAQIFNIPMPTTVDGHMILLRPTKEIDPLYYGYVIKSYQKKIESLAEGSTGQTEINRQRLQDEIYITFPKDRALQKEIGTFLFQIDEKIKNNSEINNNLLEQIKTICTAWLSEYKPFDGVMPSDWVETPLSDIAEFISGYSYKGTELTDSTIAMATIKNFDRKGGFKLDGYKEIIPSSKLKESQHAELFDTLVAHTDLTQNAEVIGNAEPVMSKSGYDDIVFSMDLVKVLPRKDSVSKFLIAAILQDKKFKAHCLGYVNGTTVLHLSKKALPEYKLLLPSDFSTLKPLDEVVTALYKQVSSNISENTYLEELRESLLPKLMSGEFDVSDIEI